MGTFGQIKKMAAGLALLGAASVCGCGGAQKPETATRSVETGPSCEALATTLDQKRAAASELLADARARVGEVQGAEALAASVARFEALASGLEASGGALCEQGAAGRRFCATRRLGALDEVTRVAQTLQADDGLSEQLWRLDGKIAWVEQTLRCDERAEQEPEAFAGLADGAMASRGGVVDGGAFRLETAGEPFVSQGVTLTSALVCQRATDGGYEPVEDCAGATLTKGDRFKLVFSLDREAHIYFYLFNGKGQFQMFFPFPGDDNKAQPRQQYFFPPGDRWVTLDDVAQVREHVMLVAASYPLKELEALRGADLPPRPDGQPHAQATELRGRIEPLLTRGGGGGQPVTIPEGKAAHVAIPVVVRSQDIAVVEYTIRHR